MSVKEIITGAESTALRCLAEKVSLFDKNLQKLVADLFDSVKKEKGVGLAAPQIGVSSAVCIASISETFVVLVNPEIIWNSDAQAEAEEGCLSLPDVWLSIPRHKEIIVKFKDEKGKDHECKLDGWDSRVVQHEVDHLNGKLIVDYKAQEAGRQGEAL